MKKEKAQGIWNNLWEEYKLEWEALWQQYKSLIVPFVEGTAKYVWQLVYGLINLVIKGLYETGVHYVKKLTEIIKKA